MKKNNVCHPYAPRVGMLKNDLLYNDLSDGCTFNILHSLILLYVNDNTKITGGCRQEQLTRLK